MPCGQCPPVAKCMCWEHYSQNADRHRSYDLQIGHRQLAVEIKLWECVVELEIVHCSPVVDAGNAPLLFVHGAFHGAWCWEYWMEWFAGRGRHTIALSLRGHAGSAERASLHEFGLNDYRDDVLETARGIGERENGQLPILVGHSMGGAIAQLAAAADPSLFNGVVLLASLPPDSFRPLELLSLLLDFRSRRATKRLMTGETPTPEETLALNSFNKRISREQAERYSSLLQPESRKAQRELITFRAPVVPARPPMLVLGSASDVVFGTTSLKRTARHFDADLTILEEGCHDVMVDPAWPEYAAQLDAWLTMKDL